MKVIYLGGRQLWQSQISLDFLDLIKPFSFLLRFLPLLLEEVRGLLGSEWLNLA